MVLQFTVSIILIPFTYIFLVFDKIKYLFSKPYQCTMDVLLRVLDLVVFFIFGFLWLLIIGVWDTIQYTINLFSTDIKLTQENDEARIAYTNALKDGSVDYQKFIEVYGDGYAKKNQADIDGSKLNRIRKKLSGCVSNPVRDGL